MNLKLVQSPVENENSIKEKKINKKSYDRKVSRNEPCPCGSGKKYKRCCGTL